MSYADASGWARDDFDRLVAVAKARSYRPEWVRYSIEKFRRVTDTEIGAINAMVDAAGPYLPPKLRWLQRNLKRTGPVSS